MELHVPYSVALLQPFFSFTFSYTLGGANSDIRVQFRGTNIDPQLGIPGGAKGVGGPPPSGTLGFDSGTTWTKELLLRIALHEAGHTLGLAHSTSPTSVMYPFVSGLQELDDETIEAIRSIYDCLPQKQLSDRASTDGPSLVFYSQPMLFGQGVEQMFMAWKGTEGDSGIYISNSSDGLNWSPQEKIDGIGSSDSPALAIYHTFPGGTFTATPFMTWKGVPGDHNIYWG